MPERTLTELRHVLANTYRRVMSPFTLFILGSSWLVAVLAGPFGTYEHLSLLPRTIYWGGVAIFGVLIGFGVRAFLFWWIGSENSYRFALLAALVLTIIFAPMVIGWRTLMIQVSPELWVSPLLIAGNTFVISAAIFTFRKFLMSPDTQTELPPEAAAESDSNVVRLLRRLPDEVKGDVLSISASNHHVEVTTEQGRVSLRLRLGDAIHEMEGVEGFCVHRSHWVARDAIEKVVRLNAQKIIVVLRNGDELPVSRKYRCNLEEVGLLQDSKAA